MMSVNLQMTNRSARARSFFIFEPDSGRPQPQQGDRSTVSIPSQHASNSTSPIGWDLSRLGSGERFAVAIATLLPWEHSLQERELHLREVRGPRGPSERERASHWAGVRVRVKTKTSFDIRSADA